MVCVCVCVYYVVWHVGEYVCAHGVVVDGCVCMG